MLFTHLFLQAGLIAALALQPVQHHNAQPIFNTKWILQVVHENNKTFTPEGRTAFIQLHAEKSSAGGNGGCNSFGSTVKVSGSRISFADIFSTKMYCDGVQGTEDAFFRELAATNRLELKEGRLLLYHDQELVIELATEK